jgi:hypothetical protein
MNQPRKRKTGLDEALKKLLHCLENFLCNLYFDPFFKTWKQPDMYAWKMRQQ